MPTDDNVNASGTTVIETPPSQPSITDDLIKSHPLYKDLEEKHAAARKGLDDKSIELKKIKTVYLGEETPPPALPKSPEPVTEDKLKAFEDRLKWETQNERKISLVQKDYDQFLSEGMNRDRALEYALLKAGLTSEKAIADQVRQQSSSMPLSGVDRSSGLDPNESEEERETRRKMGVTDEMKKKWGPEVEKHRRKWIGFAR